MKKVRKGAVLNTTIGSSGDAMDCVDFLHGGERMVCWKPTGVCTEIHQEDQQQMLLGDLTMLLVWP
eukprot:8546413-Ditylum_brightwellii.AAC.1